MEHPGNDGGAEMVSDGQDAKNGGKSKRNRHRHQKLYADIRKQMEFYFSDSNITKNRLMKEMVQGSEFVKLDIFMGFNKISALTKNIEELRKGLKNSEKLELSSDGLGVKRKVPFDETKLKDEQTVENCTIYVENIPRNVGHEWVEKIFQEFGSIAYISVPKFRKSGQPKGFAFVEFDEQISADRCLEAYGSMGACLSANIDPSDLLSVKSFEDEHTSQRNTPSDTTSPSLENARTNGSTKNSRKREFEGDNSADSSINAKKERLDYKSSNGNPGVELRSRKRNQAQSAPTPSNETDEVDKKKQKLELTSEEEAYSSAVEDPEGDVDPAKASSSVSPSKEQVSTQEKDSKKKKKRRKNKKNTGWKETDVQLENDSIQLRILPKASWRKLRNRYLNLQRENMSKVKKQLKRQKERLHSDDRIQKIERKFAAKSICVKIELNEPAESVESFRFLIADLAPKDWLNFLKFVDYKDGELEAVVRFDGGPHAMMGVRTFFQNSVGLFKNAIVMSEEETTAYWMTVKGKAKDQAKSKPKKVIRGKDRLTNEAIKAAVHIRFDDANDDNSQESEAAPAPTEDSKVI